MINYILVAIIIAIVFTYEYGLIFLCGVGLAKAFEFLADELFRRRLK